MLSPMCCAVVRVVSRDSGALDKNLRSGPESLLSFHRAAQCAYVPQVTKVQERNVLQPVGADCPNPKQGKHK